MSLTLDQALARVDILHAELMARRPAITRRERYFDGEQPLCYASDEWKKFHGRRFERFSDNWCGVVGAAAPELTEIASVRLGDDVDNLSTDEQRLWRDFNVNDGPAKSAQGFLSGAVTDRSFALVWGDQNSEPILSWEHSSQAIVGYAHDGARGPEDALKTWVEGKTEYATYYTALDVVKLERPKPLQIVEGRTDSGLIVPSSVGAPGGWKLRAIDKPVIPNPLGVVPMVEYPNRPLLSKGPVSDIEGTMAMQDAINLMWAYLFGAADYASMPARVVMGQEPPVVPILDAEGQKIGEKPLDIEALTKGRMLWLTGQTTKVGQWEAAKLDVFTEVINMMVKHVASQTKTPVNYISGELSNVNGETLNGLRLPLVMKVRDGHKHLTAPVRQTLRLMALVRDDKKVAEACRTAVIGWKNPDTSSDSQTSDAALKDSQIGWSAEGILERRYGMSQPEIDREMARRRAEANDPLAQAMRDAQQAAQQVTTDAANPAPVGS